MPTPTHLLVPALLSVLGLLGNSAEAALQALDNQALSQVTGRDGITLNLDLQTNIGKISWEDDSAVRSAATIRRAPPPPPRIATVVLQADGHALAQSHRVSRTHPPLPFPGVHD